MWHIHCKISPRSAPEWSWILVKISHITMDFLISPASDRIFLGLGSQIYITWVWMRPTVVWMVSVDQDHAFRGQHLLKLGTRSGQHHAACFHCIISPRLAPECSHEFWSKFAISPYILWYPRPPTGFFRSWPSIMHYMDINEAYSCFDGIRGPGSCLSRPTTTQTWHQIGLFDCGQ